MSLPYQTRLTEHELYSALPLKDSQIRVLHVEGRSDQSKSDQSLTCQLQVVNLSDNPKFLALSYCWGQTKKSDYTHEIKLKLDNTQHLVTIKISKAAYDALTDIREHLGSMTIWIDAICINQENITEKEMQIPLMTEIYTRAMKVCIYLGPGTKESDTAMEWMTKASGYWYRGTGLLGPASGGGFEKSWLIIMLRDWFTGKPNSKIALDELSS
jgi:Heterokaryon incompatibility protein (HET)